MTAAHLRRIDAPRFCRLDKQLNLFGGVLLVKEWECMCARADQRSSRRRAAVQAIAKNDQGLIGRGGGVGGSGGGDGDDGGVGGGDGGDGGGGGDWPGPPGPPGGGGGVWASAAPIAVISANAQPKMIAFLNMLLFHYADDARPAIKHKRR